MSSMAAVHESAAALSSPHVRPSLRPAAMASSPATISLPLRRKAGALPGFVGLKIQSRSLASSNSKGSRASRGSRNGRIVCEARDTALDLPPVTDATWKSLVLEADGPVLVEFWAPWCGPCRMLHPVVGELADEYAGKLKCFKLNTDESRWIATRYGVRSVPTIMIFSNGEKKDSVIVPPVTDTTWKSLVLKVDGPVLVQSWAPWCGPCRMLHPVAVELADEYAGQLKCFKLNTDESRSTATQYRVRSIPTIMIFHNGGKKESRGQRCSAQNHPINLHREVLVLQANNSDV